jgi:hypothetical protein
VCNISKQALPNIQICVQLLQSVIEHPYTRRYHGTPESSGSAPECGIAPTLPFYHVSSCVYSKFSA